jgi:5-methylcytosine-specific restriction endonuclease McrA
MTDSFYLSKPWFKARAKVLKRDNYQCVICNNSVYGKGAARIDHYPHSKKDRPDLALEISNLRTLCVQCDQMQSIGRGQRFNLPPKEDIDEEGYPQDWR